MLLLVALPKEIKWQGKAAVPVMLSQTLHISALFWLDDFSIVFARKWLLPAFSAMNW